MECSLEMLDAIDEKDGRFDVVFLGDGFVERDVIRALSRVRLTVGFLHPLVDDFPTAVDTKSSKQIDRIRQ